MKKYIVITICLLFLLSLVGCNNKQNEEINIRGTITSISDKNKDVLFIFVEGNKDNNTEYDKASISVDKKVNIYKKGSKDKLNKEDLKKDIKVEVIFEGPVMDSYPVQAHAKTIIIQ